MHIILQPITKEQDEEISNIFMQIKDREDISVISIEKEFNVSLIIANKVHDNYKIYHDRSKIDRAEREVIKYNLFTVESIQKHFNVCTELAKIMHQSVTEL